MNPLNLYNLKIFVDAAKAHSMTRAAELNFISRPAVSHAIRNLEQELDLELLVHKPRSFELTPQGIELLEKSMSILDEMRDLKASLKGSNRNASLLVTIGCVRSLASDMLIRALVGLRKQHPNISVKVVIANSEVLISHLEQKKIDMALILGDDTLYGAHEVIIDRGSFVVAIPPRSDPLKIRYALTERRPETERARALFARQFDQEMPLMAEIPSWDAILNWIKLGQCGGLVPRFLLAGYRKNQLRILFPKVFPYEIKAVYPKSRFLDQILKDFVQHCKATISVGRENTKL